MSRCPMVVAATLALLVGTVVGSHSFFASPFHTMDFRDPWGSELPTTGGRTSHHWPTDHGRFDHFGAQRRAPSAHSYHHPFFNNYINDDDNWEMPPCPPYEPMTVQSSWREAVGGSFTLGATLPGVDPSNRRVWLSADGSALHIGAVRALPVRGRECLPREARVSTDGRREIFEAAVLVPKTCDTAGLVVRHARRGLEIIMPKKVYKPPPTRVGTSAEGVKTVASTRLMRLAVAPMAVHQPQPVVLPYPSEGVEVVDDDFPEPEKLPDAADGWWDKRGEFHLY